MTGASVTYDPNDHLIQLVIVETVDLSTFRTHTPEIARLAKEHNCYRILTDMRQARLGFSAVMIFNIPELFAKMLAEFGVQLLDFKRALVVSNDFEDVIFYETVSRNRNHNIRIFTEFEEARQWLLKK